MNKDLRDSVRFSFGIRKRVPDPLTPAKNASKFLDPSPSAPLRVRISAARSRSAHAR